MSPTLQFQIDDISYNYTCFQHIFSENYKLLSQISVSPNRNQEYDPKKIYNGYSLANTSPTKHIENVKVFEL